jgi:menaquinol-cytochrome c reductase iron-sulfur subunit
MSQNHSSKDNRPEGEPRELNLDDKNLTRRQFLSYALGGTGAFMGALVVAPLVVSAFDPIHRTAGGSFNKTNWKVSDFNEDLPSHKTFSQHVDDGWNSSDVPNDVYVIIYDNKLMIMSHVCTHLGCHVDEGANFPSQYGTGIYFHCPCHGSKYNKYGVPTNDSPAPRPLDLFEYKLESDGTISLGSTFTRSSNANWKSNTNPTIR